MCWVQEGISLPTSCYNRGPWQEGGAISFHSSGTWMSKIKTQHGQVWGRLTACSCHLNEVPSHMKNRGGGLCGGPRRNNASPSWSS